MKAQPVEFWDNIAEGYAKKPIANPEAYQRKLGFTKPLLRSDERLLDIGCGTGSLALELSPSVKHVDAIDISSEMVRIANEKAKVQGVKNASFHAARLDQMPRFEDGTFGVICAYNILHLVHERPALLRELWRMLKPGGSLVSSTSCLGESLLPLWMVIRVMQWVGKAPPVDIIKVEDLRAELEQAGFVDVRREIVNDDKQCAFMLAKKAA